MRAFIAWIFIAVAAGGCTCSAPEPVGEARAAVTAGAAPAHTSKVPLDPPREAAGVRFVSYRVGGAGVDERVPTIVAIHGHCDNPEGFAPTFAGLQVRARVVLPYGTLPCADYPGGFDWYLVDHATDRLPPVFDAPVRGALPTMAAFLAALPGVVPMVGRPIVTGFSQGAIMTMTVTAHHPELVELAAPAAGFMPFALPPPAAAGAPRLPRIVAFHGDADTAIRIEWDTKSIDALKAAGFEAELRRYPGVTHVFSKEELADYLGLLDDTARRLTAP